MKKLVSFLCLYMCLVSSAHAAIMGAPFQPEIDVRFNNIEQSIYSIPEAGNQGVFVDHHVKAVISTSASGTLSTGITIPQNAIIQQAYWFVSASGSPVNGTTLAFQCDAANDIYSATNITNFQNNTITSGVETGTAANMHLVTTAGGCPVKAVVAVNTPTGAVWDLFIDYVIAK